MNFQGPWAGIDPCQLPLSTRHPGNPLDGALNKFKSLSKAYNPKPVNYGETTNPTILRTSRTIGAAIARARAEPSANIPST